MLGGSLTVKPSVLPAIGASFTILADGGTGSVSGAFAGLPEGATMVVNGATYQISYKGGTGNDVTLKRVS
jgi:hypothetical protein